MLVSARELSIEILINIFENGVFCNTALHECLGKWSALDNKERAFLTLLVEGTVERRIEIDYVINQYSKKPVNKLKPYIRNVLRMSVYQIMYMDKVPQSAAVNEAVKLVVKKGFGGLRGFVNGILRNISRNKDNITYPDCESDFVDYISVKYSMPEWIVKHFMEEMTKEEVIKSMEYYLSNTDTVVRLTDRGIKQSELLELFQKENITYRQGNIFDFAYRLSTTGRIDKLPGFLEGAFVVQDESSMIPGYIVLNYCRKQCEKKQNISIRIMDMCAAPGGKTLHVAGMSSYPIQVDSYDISDYKVKRIADNAQRLGLHNIIASVMDALKYNEKLREQYDVVIADLPCSGLGVLAKKPDIKYNTNNDALDELAGIQRQMLSNAAAYTKPGGLIVYSTCTIDKQENEDNAKHFLHNNPDFEKCNLCDLLGDNIPENLAKSCTDEGYIKIIPGNVQSDGFFVAAFQKKCAVDIQ